jgi:hypothetical protein
MQKHRNDSRLACVANDQLEVADVCVCACGVPPDCASQEPGELPGIGGVCFDGERLYCATEVY